MDRTPYQENIIKRYYEHKPEIMRQKLSELTTDLYLAETPKKRDAIWERIVLALRNLKVPEERINSLKQRNDPVALAHFIENHLEKF